MNRASIRPVAVLLLIGSLLPAPRALALDPRKALTQYGHSVWQTEDGLPQHSVQAVLQTRDGYLWIGTQEGLVRFDGVRFTVFDRKTTPAIRNNNIQALCQGRDGSLWIGTGGGGLVRLLDGSFTLYATEQGLSSASIWALFEDREGTLWIGTAGGGLDRFRDGRFTADTKKDGLSADHVLSIQGDKAGDLWIGTDGGGLTRLSGGTFSSFRHADGLAGDTVYAIREDRGGSLWVGTAEGLTRLREGRFQTFTSRDGLPANRVEALLEDRDGNLWVGTYGGGLCRLHDGRFSSITTKEGLTNDMVKALYEDREGGLWIGTRTGGLNRLKDGTVITYSTREGLSHEVVWAVLEDRAGDLWIGTDGGGLDRFRDGKFTAYTTRDGLGANMVRALAEGRDGSLWIGTWGGGVSRLKGGRFSTFRKEAGRGLSHNFVRALYEDRDGDLWIGTYGGGLNRLRHGRFTVYDKHDGLGSDTIYCILQDRDGDLWIGTRGGGLSRFRNGAITTYTAKDGLSDEVVVSLHEDAQGALWVGTTGGLNRLKDGRFASLSAREGLFDDVAYQILEDSSGNLWMSSNKGIYRVKKKEVEDVLEGRAKSVSSVSYGKTDGMRASECNGGVQPAGWKGRDGRLWFPTIRGVAMIDPARLRTNERPPPVVIEQAVIDGRTTDVRGEVEAPPGRRELLFRYTGLGLLAPEKVLFRRKLEGYDADWVEAGTRREAHYTNIPAGRYTFRVIACNEDGVWNETGASLSFYLRPHFYENAGFRAFCVVLLLLAGYGLYRLRVRQLQARQRALVGLVDERTQDLVEATRKLEEVNRGLRDAIRVKEEVVSIVAHDFRSPLTVVQGYGELLETQAPGPETRKMCGVITAQARHLASLAADTLTMSRIETGNLPLELGPVRISDLLRSLVEARSADRSLAISLDAPDEVVVVEGDLDRLQQVIDNLITNAIKYSPNGARVRLAIRDEGAGVHVSVSDEGIGIPPEELPRLFQRFSRLEGGRRRGISGTGLGLYICRSIVEAHGGRIWAESRPGEGSTFHLVLPRKRTLPESKPA